MFIEVYEFFNSRTQQCEMQKDTAIMARNRC